MSKKLDNIRCLQCKIIEIDFEIKKEEHEKSLPLLGGFVSVYGVILGHTLMPAYKIIEMWILGAVFLYLLYDSYKRLKRIINLESRKCEYKKELLLLQYKKRGRFE